jgi:hypothetical protein
MTPEQRILVSQFYAKFDIGSHVPHKKIVNIENLVYMGNIVASEFDNYDVNKMYLCLSAFFDSTEITNSVKSYIELHDEADNIVFRILQVAMGWDGTSVLAAGLTVHVVNKAFSRVSLTSPEYQNISFIGYRVTLT